MAVTVSVVKRSKMGGLHAIVADITLDNSYVTGGEPVDPVLLGLTNIDFVLPSPTSGYTFEFDEVNSKLLAFYGTNASAAHTHTFTGSALAAHGHTENTAAAYTQNATTGTITAGTPAGTNATAGAVTAAPGAEVAAATNLSAVKVRVLAVGI